MKVYAETPGRQVAQVLSDLVTVAWVWVWVRVGFAVRDLLAQLAAPGRQVEEAGSQVAEASAQAGQRLADVPLIGEQIAEPFNAVADGARGLSRAGVEQQGIALSVATWLGLVVALTPILVFVTLWLWWRLRWIREASAAARLRNSDLAEPVLALRALARLPLRKLRIGAGEDPYARFREGEYHRLADLELEALGLRRRDHPR